MGTSVRRTNWAGGVLTSMVTIFVGCRQVTTTAHGTSARATPWEAEAPRGDASTPPRDASRDAPPSVPKTFLTPKRGALELKGDRRVLHWQAPDGPSRLIAHLHGACVTVDYSCGSLAQAASESGWLVCPEGNAKCDAGDAPTWEGPYAEWDQDLERAIAALERKQPGKLDRRNAILTGYSRGAHAVPSIAAAHPGRWPYLLLIEADAAPRVERLRAAGIRAIAYIAGEWGDQLAGARKASESLLGEGFPARLFVMPKTGHPYSSNVNDLIREAFAFLLSVTSTTGDGGTEAPK